MATKNKISQYRGRLDKTLACHDLTNKDEIRKLVKNKLSHPSQDGGKGYADSTLNKRTEEVSHFLDMLRSASMVDESKNHQASHSQWKIKQDTEELRVMYREGPPGTPFHILLVEGYVDGPVDSCLCVSWETTLYQKWWPQYNVPSFKITYSQCLRQVQIGEQVSVVRVKVSWPLSAREAFLHYFEFEYFQDDLIVVLLNTISDVDPINEDGLTSDQIPDSKGMVKIDLVGGFAIQKVSPERSYFRTIASIDMKLDFVPPSLINFISRQLIGSGFKLYQKAVASVAKKDGDFNNALEDPMYCRIRDALYSKHKTNTVPETENPSHDALSTEEDNFICAALDSEKIRGEILAYVKTTEILAEKSGLTDLQAVSEIEEEVLDVTIMEEEIEEKIIEGKEINQVIIKEEESKESVTEVEETEENMVDEEANNDDAILDKGSKRVAPDKQIEGYKGVNTIKEVHIRPEVEQALETLEKAISLFRELGISTQNQTSSFVTKEPPNFREGIGENYSEDGESTSGGLFSLEDRDPKETNIINPIAEGVPGEMMKNLSIRSPMNTRSNSHPREMYHNKVAPISPEQKVEVLEPPHRKSLDGQLSEDMVNNSEKIIIDENDIESSQEQRKKSSRQKKNRFCFCMHFAPGE